MAGEESCCLPVLHLPVVAWPREDENENPSQDQSKHWQASKLCDCDWGGRDLHASGGCECKAGSQRHSGGLRGYKGDGIKREKIGCWEAFILAALLDPTPEACTCLSVGFSEKQNDDGGEQACDLAASRHGDPLGGVLLKCWRQDVSRNLCFALKEAASAWQGFAEPSC